MTAAVPPPPPRRFARGKQLPLFTGEGRYLCEWCAEVLDSARRFCRPPRDCRALAARARRRTTKGAA